MVCRTDIYIFYHVQFCKASKPHRNAKLLAVLKLSFTYSVMHTRATIEESNLQGKHHVHILEGLLLGMTHWWEEALQSQNFAA